MGQGQVRGSRKVLDNDAPAVPRATVRHHVNKLANNPRRPAVANMLRRLPVPLPLLYRQCPGRGNAFTVRQF